MTSNALGRDALSMAARPDKRPNRALSLDGVLDLMDSGCPVSEFERLLREDGFDVAGNWWSLYTAWRSPEANEMTQWLRRVKQERSFGGAPLSEQEGVRLLHHALEEGDAQFVEAEHSARCEWFWQVDDEGATALHACARGGVVELLPLAGGDINCRDHGGNTPLHEASSWGRLAMTKALVEELGATVDSKNASGRTPLHLAADKAVSEYLLKAGADIEARDDRGFTPLLRACQLGEEELVWSLVKLGADVHAKDSVGRTTLHAASRADRVTLIELLVKLGCNPQERNAQGGTALHEAVAGGAGRAIRWLVLHHGADVRAQDSRGKTALGSVGQFHPSDPFLLIHPKTLKEDLCKVEICSEELVADIKRYPGGVEEWAPRRFARETRYDLLAWRRARVMSE
jgi:ankyrin repeat protein